MTGNRKWYSILVVAFLALPLTGSKADSTADAKRAIQAQYDKSNAAAAKKDSKGVTSVFTKDRVSVTSKGVTTSIQDEKKQMEQVFSAAQSCVVTSTILSVSLTGSQAKVRVKEHGKIVLPNPKTMVNSNLVEDSIREDTWIKSGGAWLEKKSVEKSSKVTIDGKEVAQ